MRDRLLRALRDDPAGRGAASDRALLDAAMALGVPRGDPVVRQRLAYQAEQLVLARPVTEAVSDAELRRYHERHAARYTAPARFSLAQVFVSRSRRGERAARDAERLSARLQGKKTPPLDATKCGDPSLLPPELEDVDAAALDARFGPGFAAAVAGLPGGVWSGPIPSAYGYHVVLVRSSSPAALAPLTAVRERVLADYRHDRRKETLAGRVRALRAGYRIDVRRSPS